MERVYSGATRVNRLSMQESEIKRKIGELPAVILSAGEGSRLRNGENCVPKPLTPLLGLTLLERTILTCRDAGVRDFYVVVGYRKEELIHHVKELEGKHGLSLKVVENPNWEEGNGTSVSACSSYISGPFLLLMCDHLFEPGILEELVAADDGEEVCRLAVDSGIKDIFDPEDSTLVRLDRDAITAMDKGLENPDGVDTGLFLCRPMLFSALEKARREGDGSLSGGIRRLIEGGDMRAVDVGDRFWLDVDTPEALSAGEDRLMVKLKTAKRIDGPISRYINRFFSLKITRRLAPYSITPNQVSVVSTLYGLAGAAFFFGAGFVADRSLLWIWLMTALAGIFIQISSILDGVDGEIARLKHQAGPYGAYLDNILDRYVDGVAVAGMVYASYAATGSFTIVLVGFLALLGLPLSSIHRAKFLAETGRNYLAGDDGPLRYLPYSRDVRLFVIFMAGVLNQVEPAIYFLAIVTNFMALLRLATVKKALERMRD